MKLALGCWDLDLDSDSGLGLGFDWVSSRLGRVNLMLDWGQETNCHLGWEEGCHHCCCHHLHHHCRLLRHPDFETESGLELGWES